MTERTTAASGELLLVRRSLINYGDWHTNLQNYCNLQLGGIVKLNVPRPFLAVVKQHVLTRQGSSGAAINGSPHLSLDNFINALPDTQHIKLNQVLVKRAFWLRRRHMDAMLALSLEDDRLTAEHQAATNYLAKEGYDEDMGRKYIPMVPLGHENAGLNQSQRDKLADLIRPLIPTAVSLGQIETITGPS